MVLLSEEIFSAAKAACGAKLLDRIREHVCTEYLDRKIANMLGMQMNDITDETQVVMLSGLI